MTLMNASTSIYRLYLVLYTRLYLVLYKHQIKSERASIIVDIRSISTKKTFENLFLIPRLI